MPRCGKTLAGSAALVAVLLAGCGSPASPSKAAVVSQLEKDPDFAPLKDAVQPAEYQAFIGCVADFLLRKGQAGDLDQYVHGKRNLKDVRGFASESDSTTTAKQCATQAGIASAPSPTPIQTPTATPTSGATPSD